MELKQQRYNVRWDCPHCGNSHNWWWEDEFEAHDDGECDLICDRCMEPSKCKGDGTGFYVAIKYEEPKPPVEQRVSDLESLEEDLHNYVRGLEDKVNAVHKQSFDAINRLSKRLLKLEGKLAERRAEFYGYEHDENPIVPTKGDMRIDDADPTVMYIYDGTRWCRTY